MPKQLYGAAFALMLTVLACNAPLPDVTETPTVTTETPMVVCTPPPCSEDEVYYCPDECPGGCGTECATPTPGQPTASPSVVPADTPMVMCTPPPCSEDEVYYCPDECPGGCGTECATPTAAPPGASPPTIHAFTADRTTIVEGEQVTLSWQATGGTEAFIQWVTREAILAAAPGPLNPAGGSVTITPTGDGDITLLVKNSAGSAEAYVQLVITCPHPWAPALDGP
ncbi:MAG TPA: hypothetical protein ENN99_03895, partial [Chloroflexi bacterium]|nr:hypothetical protein [Chloroflexota bacterium]